MVKTQTYASFIMFLFLFSLGIFMRINGQEHGRWCVAKPSTESEILIENINFVCSTFDCRILESGGPCFDPDTPLNHASVAMNIYFQAQGRRFWNCDFNKSGVITMTDPSYGNCIYQYRK